MFQCVLSAFFDISAEEVTELLPENFTGKFILHSPARAGRLERFVITVIQCTTIGTDTGCIQRTLEVAETLQAFLSGTDRQCRHVQGCIRCLLAVVLDGLHGSIQRWLALHHHCSQVRYFPDQVAKDEVANSIFQHDGKGDGILWDGIDFADDSLNEADKEKHDHELHTKSEDR